MAWVVVSLDLGQIMIVLDKCLSVINSGHNVPTHLAYYVNEIFVENKYMNGNIGRIFGL